MQPEPQRNGINITWKWLAGILMTVLIGGVIGLMNYTAGQISEINAKMSPIESRVSVVEEKNSGVNMRLDRIEQKVDTLLLKIK